MIVGHRNQFAERRYSISESQLNSIIRRAFAEGYASKEEEAKEEPVLDEKAEKRRKERKGWKLQNSHRGLGRNLIIGGLWSNYFTGGIGSALGSYLGKKEVDKDYREGYSDEDIIERASERGTKYGAIGGLGSSVLRSAVALDNPGFAELVKKNPKAAIMNAGIEMAARSGLGALGGYLGSRKNAETRLELPRVRIEKEQYK